MSANPRLTNKDYALIKSALRRAFARSELHSSVMEEGRVEHYDTRYPRCENWVWVECCGEVCRRWTVEVDHVVPFVEIGKEFKDYTMSEAVDRLWCDRSNLQRICSDCHDRKSAAEREQRKALKPKKVKVGKKG